MGTKHGRGAGHVFFMGTHCRGHPYYTASSGVANMMTNKWEHQGRSYSGTQLGCSGRNVFSALSSCLMDGFQGGGKLRGIHFPNASTFSFKSLLMWAAAQTGCSLRVTPSQQGLQSETRHCLGDPPLHLSLSCQPFLAWLSLL